MMETTEYWKNHNYELVLTEDQSPTLRWLDNANQETMHHRGGAYTETQLIYGEPLRECMRSGGRSALSVGLGLGYNEILVALEALKNQIQPQDFHLLSFESESFLKNHFLEWVQTSETDFIYDQIFSFFQSSQKTQTKEWLRRALQTENWILQGALETNFEIPRTYEILFYDAFSSKTSPHLWQEEFLTRFFAKVSAPNSWICTYACTGALKRSLRANGFEVILQDGFHSKKDRTMGVRSLSSAR